jgi:hypothetical protein
MLQDWASHMTITPKQQLATKNSSLFNLSVAEVESFIYRLRCLFDKSNYHEQILLMQTAPVEWGWKNIESFFNCTSHQARAAVIQRTTHGDLSKPVHSRGNKPFDSTTTQIIQDFYLDDEISRASSNTKDIRKPKGIGAVAIRYMTMSIGETFELFKTKYFDLKVSRSKFYALKPSWVREDCPHQVCMCIHHQNIDLLLTVRKYLQISHFKQFCFHTRRSEKHWEFS